MNNKRLWIAVALLTFLLALYLAYSQSNKRKEAEAVARHTKAMLFQLNWIDFAQQVRTELEEKKLLDTLPLSEHITRKLDRIFLDTKYYLGEEKDRLLNEVGKIDIRGTNDKQKLQSKNLSQWLNTSSLDDFSKIELSVTYFVEGLAETDLLGYITNKNNFNTFYELKTFLESLDQKYAKPELSVYDYLSVYLPMVISMLSIVVWFYGVLDVRRHEANTGLQPTLGREAAEGS